RQHTPTLSPYTTLFRSRHDRFTFRDHDVTNYLHVEVPVDAVLHFASPASPRDYLQHPIHTLKVGALGTLRGLGLAKAKGAAFVLDRKSTRLNSSHEWIS